MYNNLLLSYKKIYNNNEYFYYISCYTRQCIITLFIFHYIRRYIITTNIFIIHESVYRVIRDNV